MTKILSVANAKGGVGKSTFTCLLSVALAKDRGFKIAVLDCDKQETIKELFDLEKSEGLSPLIEVVDIAPLHVDRWLELYKMDYDFVFIDIPRITNNKDNADNIGLLYKCDGILIPFLGGFADVASTQNFLVIIDDIKKLNKDTGKDFIVRAFLNRGNQRTENKDALDFIHGLNIETLPSVNDLKVFASPSCTYSILDTSEGRRRFGSFFNHFTKTFIDG